VALEALLASMVIPIHPAFSLSRADTALDNADHDAGHVEGRKASHQDDEYQDPNLDHQGGLLPPLLAALDTPSLPSFFWRTLASALAKPVAEIISKGGVSARQLKANKDRVRDAVRLSVDRGSRIPDAVFDSNTGHGKKDGQRKGWEREANVMIAAITGNLGR
jgi:hypothetical protein